MNPSKLIACTTILLAPLLTLAAPAPGGKELAEVPGSDYQVTMYRATTDDKREAIGVVTIREIEGQGIRLIPDLENLPPGEHGFHVHRFDRCVPTVSEDGQPVIGMEAGPHLDPESTDRHAGPEGDGHLGDLPRLVVDEDGRATTEVDAPRLSVKDVAGRALIIHAGGDNYADEPEADGGGGQRIACGVIKQGPIYRPGSSDQPDSGMDMD